MTAMPCGQKNSNNAKDHSHTVTPPLAAMVGTTLRLTMATTNNKTRSPGPRTRRKWGAPGAAGVRLTSFANGFLPRLPYQSLVSCRTDKSEASLFLGLSKGRCDFFEYREVFVDIRLGMLHGDGPLLVPPIGLRQHSSIDHAKPVVAPEIDVDLGPVAVVLNLLRIEHQDAVDAGAGDVGLQAGFLDDGAIAFGEIFAEFANVRIILAREDLAERRQARSHGHTVRVVGAAVEDLVLRDQIHYRAARAECSQRQAAADGLCQADHVRLHAEKFAGTAPGKLRARFHFVEDQ